MAIPSDSPRVALLKKDFEKAFGRPIRTPKDFTHAVSFVFEKTKDMISDSTFRRLYVETKKYKHVSDDILNILSKAIGYKHFQDFFGNKIKYNSKSIVFEETFTSNPDKMWNVRQFCMDYYNLEYVEETQEHSGYFRYKSNTREVRNDDCCCAEWVGDLREEADNKLRDFYYVFGVGEFPFITITIIRLGNKEHYFYTIHR